MQIIIDNSALLGSKCGISRYTECIIQGLQSKLEVNSIKLFPAARLCECASCESSFDSSFHQIFDLYNLNISRAYSSSVKNIEELNQRINSSYIKGSSSSLKLKREVFRLVKKFTKVLFNEQKIYRKALKDIHIFHSLYGAIPEDVRKNKNISKCITVHDLIPALRPELILGGLRHGDYNFIKQLKQLSTEETIFTVSEHSKNDLCNYNSKIDPINVHVTHLAAADSFQPVQDKGTIQEVIRKFNIPSNAKYILSSFADDLKKNMPFVIKAFLNLIKTENITDLYLVLAGSTHYGYRSKLNSLPRDVFENISNNSDKIILTDFVNDHDMAALHSGALCFAFPSLYEGFGLPVLEAMQCGVPVITSNVSSLPEIAGGAALLVDPCDSNSLNQAILNIYNNSSLAKELSEKGINRARDFSWDKCVDKMIQVYKQSLV